MSVEEIKKKRKKRIKIDDEEINDDELKVSFENESENAEKEIEPKEIKKKSSKLSFVLNGEAIDADLDILTKIPKFNDLTPEKISNIMAESPTLQTRWNILYNEACFLYEQTKIEYDIWHSKMYDHYRNQVLLEGDKPTEARIDNLIKQDDNYLKSQIKISELKEKMNTIKAIAIGLSSRGDKAVSIAHLLKRELTTLSDTNTKIYDQI